MYGLFPRLEERKNQVAGTLSGGEQQMLATARALMSRPRVLLMDEPSMGLAPVLVEAIFSIIEDINREGTTILLVEQNAHMALQIANRGYVLQTGEIVLQDSAAALRQQRDGAESVSGYRLDSSLFACKMSQVHPACWDRPGSFAYAERKLMDLRFSPRLKYGCITHDEAIAAMKQAFVGTCRPVSRLVPLRTHLGISASGSTLIMPAFLPQTADLAVKVVSVFPDNAHAHSPPFMRSFLLSTPKQASPWR